MRIGRTVQHASAVDTTQITALFSPCRTWRYRFTLLFSGRKGSMLTIFLKNPSSASEMAADKTVRTASEYVWRHFPQAGGLHVLNLYALRGTDSKEVGGTLRQQGEAYVIGPENDAVISQTLSTSQAVIIAWVAMRVFRLSPTIGAWSTASVYWTKVNRLSGEMREGDQKNIHFMRAIGPMTTI